MEYLSLRRLGCGGCNEWPGYGSDAGGEWNGMGSRCVVGFDFKSASERGCPDRIGSDGDGAGCKGGESGAAIVDESEVLRVCQGKTLKSQDSTAGVGECDHLWGSGCREVQ